MCEIHKSAKVNSPLLLRLMQLSEKETVFSRTRVVNDQYF